MSINLKRMIEGYTEAMMFTDMAPGDDCANCEFSKELIVRATADCAAFIEACSELLLDALAELAPEYSDEQCGHDFWLTRNGHGAGFWDRSELDVGITDVVSGFVGTLGSALTDVAGKAGSCELYAGDDGKAYAT